MAAKKPVVLTTTGKLQQIQTADWIAGLQKGVDVQTQNATLQDIADVDVTEDSILIKLEDGSAIAEPVAEIIAGGMVPLVIEDGKRYLIPEGKQAVAGYPIEIDGDGVLEIDGMLISV